jgi:dTDP-4-amino-4,6-dideoxygalactose transaminase
MVCSNNPDIGPTLQMWGDKHYDRKTGTRAPTQLGMNYRMSEPLSAIAAAQLPKMESICDARTRAGTRLSEAIKDLPGIQIPEVDHEDNSSYWFYLFRLDLSVLTCTRDEFTKALGAERVPANAGYLPMAVYRYPVFQDHNFFGGTWPTRDLGLTEMDYTKVNCPVAEEILETCIFIGIKESMTDSYTDKMAAAICKVAVHYAK